MIKKVNSNAIICEPSLFLNQEQHGCNAVQWFNPLPRIYEFCPSKLIIIGEKIGW